MAKGKLYGGRWKTCGGLGEGGQGHVFRAIDATQQLPGEFALKRVLNPERRKRFHNEIDATKRLSHPNIIRLIDHSALNEPDVGDGPSFYVMPIAEGGDLSDRDRLSIYAGSIDAVLQVTGQVANALDAAHTGGVIHRDIKPPNILFTGKSHNIWVSDFGISLIRGADRSTETGEVVGPRGFMAPELENGGRLDVTPAADVYSLGKLIFYMFSGGIVVPRETVDDERYDRLFAGGQRPQRLRFLLRRMISPLTQRFQTMKEVIHGLQALEDWERNAQLVPIAAEGLAGIEELRRRARKVRQVAAENESARDQERRAVQSVKDGFEAWLKAELTVAASRFGSDDDIEVTAGEVGDIGKEYRLVPSSGNVGYAPLTALELRLRTAEDNFRSLHRLRVQLCEGPKTIVSGTAQVLGAPRPEPAARPVQDPQLAMIPVYFQTDFRGGLNSPPVLAGFLTKKAAQGTLLGRLVGLDAGRQASALQSYRAEKLLRTFHPELSQRVPFQASEWLNAAEALQIGLKEAIDTFIDFVVSGAMSIGP
jgi:serine/threonine protein kinase